MKNNLLNHITEPHIPSGEPASLEAAIGRMLGGSADRFFLQFWARSRSLRPWGGSELVRHLRRRSFPRGLDGDAAGSLCFVGVDAGKRYLRRHPAAEYLLQAVSRGDVASQ